MTPASKTQIRVLKIFGLPTADEYESAASILAASGIRGDAMPAGETWRSVAKMSDSELQSLLQPLSSAELADSVNDIHFA